jgi:response regulator RpfG family c-di-GMP phosphodiesterase
LRKALSVTDENTIKAINAAALLHDTGKLAVPEYI